jgi:hypothetical protein
MGRPARNPKYQDDVEGLHKNLQFHRHEWLVQRMGWVLLAGVIVAALLGAFGDGPLAHASLTGPTATFEYDRLARRESSTRWIVTPTARPGSAGGATLSIAFDAQLLAKYRVTDINPEPERTRLAGNQVVHEFAAAQAAAQPIVFYVETRDIGMQHGTIRVANGAPMAFEQFIYP